MSSDLDKENHTPSPSTPIDLLRGHPTTSLLATTPFLAATDGLLGKPDELPGDSYDVNRHPLGYGTDAGNVEVRREIVRWQGELYYAGARARDGDDMGGSEAGDGDGVGGNGGGGGGVGDLDIDAAASRLNLTNGASYGLMNALVQCTSPGTGYTRRAFIVVPTYFLACAIFIDAGFANILTPLPYPPPPGPGAKSFPDLLLAALQADSTAPPQPAVDLAAGLRPITTPGGNTPKKRIYKYVLYCVPTYSNPTGTTWDLETRTRVVQIAREWDVLVISDDVYDFLTWRAPSAHASPPPPPPTPPPLRLVDIDRRLILRSSKPGEGADLDPAEEAGNTLTNSSFSKLLGPGLRCGWQESATARLAQQLARGGANHSGGCPSQYTSCVIHRLLLPRSTGKAGGGSGSGRGIDEVITKVATTLGYRAARIVEACYRYLPPGSEVLGHPPPGGVVDGDGDADATPPGGGYFLWVALGPPAPHPDAVDAGEVIALAARGEKLQSQSIFSSQSGEGEGEEGVYINRVRVGGGELFECPGFEEGFGRRWVRLAVSWCEAGVGVEGVRRLGGAVGRWKAGRGGR